MDPRNQSDIAIVGLAFRFPLGDDETEFVDNLIRGVRGITFVPGHDGCVMQGKHFEVPARGLIPGIDLFDAGFFSIPKNEAEILDPQHRLFLECAWHALENAGYNPDSYEGRISIYAGVNRSTYLSPSDPQFVSPSERLQAYIGNAPDFLPTRVSYKLNLRGESIAVQTACSSSLVAVHLACQSLLGGVSDIALAGGVSIAVRDVPGYSFERGLIYSPDGACRAFDEGASGTVEGDGLGIVVLKKLDDSLQDGDYIYAVIKSTNVNNDGRIRAGYMAPGVLGQAGLIADAIANSGIPVETIGYVEAHGTGTPLGDPIEVEALTRAFRVLSDRKGFCALGSIKPSIGHLIHAAGIAGLIKTVMVLKHGWIPPNVDFATPNRRINFEDSPFYVPTEPVEWRARNAPRRAGVSSFGVGGTNAHVILEEAPPVSPAPPSRPPYLVPLSTRSPVALKNLRSLLRAYLVNHPELDLADVAYTLGEGRKAFAQRWAVVVNGRETLLSLLAGDVSRQQDTDAEDGGDVACGDGPGCGVPSKWKDLSDLARRWKSGADVDLREAYVDSARRRVPLVGYPFERTSFWHGPKPDWIGLPDVLCAPPRSIPVSMSPKPNLLPRSIHIPHVEEGHVESSGSVASTVAEIVRRKVGGREQIGDDEDFLALGIESMVLLDLLSECETAFGIEIPIDEGFSALSLRKLSDLCGRLCGGEASKSVEEA